MGYDANENLTGDYFLVTNSAPYYSKDEFGVIYNGNAGKVEIDLDFER
jgi:hypothetical protein